ncbi:hypothetical protein E4U37_001108 [Claviceps purpurea]|nr:hypothetical protein E4U37_001108 [Claviceps purpurea]
MVTLASTAIKESMALVSSRRCFGADDLQKRVALLAAAANLSRFSFIDNTTTLGDTPENTPGNTVETRYNDLQNNDNFDKPINFDRKFGFA